MGNTQWIAARRIVRDLLPLQLKQAVQRSRIKRGCRLLEPQLAKMRAQGKTVVHFLHIGKTGGTAVKTALRGNLTTADYHITARGHGATLAHVPPGDKAMFVVRDPVKRFVSSFYAGLYHLETIYQKPRGLHDRLAFHRFKSPNDLAEALTCANHRRRRHAISAMRSIPHVNMPIEYWLGSRDHLMARAEDILFIGFQERLAEDWEALKQIVGLDEQLQLPTDRKAANVSPRSERPELTELAEKNIRDWYAQDYQLIESCRKLAGQISERLSSYQ